MGRDASGVPDAFGEFEASYIVTNPPYGRGVVDTIAEATIARVRSGQVLGVAMLMRANWDLAQRRANLFALPEYAGQIRMRFRPWWSEERKAQPIHNFVVACLDRAQAGRRAGDPLLASVPGASSRLLSRSAG